MLDIKHIRKDPDAIRQAMKRLRADTPLEAILDLDEKLRHAIGDAETLKAERNMVSKEIAREKDTDVRVVRIAAMRDVGDKIQALDVKIRDLEEKLQAALLQMPNIPHPSVPDGDSEANNTVMYEDGEKRVFDFEPRPHWEIAEALDIIDFERGTKISGSRFYILKGAGARLQRAIISFMLDVHVNRHGYTEIYPPFMVREECMLGAGQLPKFGANLYRDAEEDYYFIPTAEVPVTNLHSGEIIEAAGLPINYVAYSACFRREKMSAGRDVRGIKRGHQFDKVEMVKFVVPGNSYTELETLRKQAETICCLLKIPHRVVDICAADLSFTATKKYDIELWAPGCNEWLEVSSCSNFEDFQARRANIRYRPAPKAKPQFVHTLNGSGLALPRTLIAILENFQQKDGTVLIPDILVPYMGGQTSISSRQ